MPVTAVASILSVVAGVVNGLVAVPIPLITLNLRKKTLWEFENIWFPMSLFSLFLLPICGFFIFVPFGQIQRAFEEFQAVQWIAPCVFLFFFVVLGFMMWGWSVDLIGLGLATSVSFGVQAIVDSLAKAIYYQKELLTVNGVFIIVGCVVILIGVVVIIVAIFFFERHTREKRHERLQNIIDDINRERVRLNKEKQIKGKLKGKVKKRTVIISFFAGLALSILSGICYPMFSAAFISATTLLQQFETRGVNPFQGKIIILSFGLVVGGIACSLISLLLLFAKKTIKKYAVFSGGFVALDGCTNAKPYRLLNLLITFIMAVLWYGGLVLVIYAEGDNTRTGWHVGYYCVCTIIVAGTLSLFPLMELKKTKLVERIMLPIGMVISLFGFVVLQLGNYGQFTSQQA